MVSSMPSTGGQPIEPHLTSLENASAFKWKSPAVTTKVRAYIEEHKKTLTQQDVDALKEARGLIEKNCKKLEKKTTGFMSYFTRIFDRKSFLKAKDQLNQLDELKKLIESCRVMPAKPPESPPKPESAPVSQKEIPVLHEITHEETPPPAPLSETIVTTPAPLPVSAEAVRLSTDSPPSAPPPIAAAPPPPLFKAPPPPPPAAAGPKKSPEELHHDREMQRITREQNERADPIKQFYKPIESKDPSRLGTIEGRKVGIRDLKETPDELAEDLAEDLADSPALYEKIKEKIKTRIYTKMEKRENELKTLEGSLTTIKMVPAEDFKKGLSKYTNAELQLMTAILFADSDATQPRIQYSNTESVKKALQAAPTLKEEAWAKAFTGGEGRQETWQRILNHHITSFISVLEERHKNPTLEPKYEPKPYNPAGKTSPERSQTLLKAEKPAAEFDPSQIFTVKLKKAGSDEGIQRAGPREN